MHDDGFMKYYRQVRPTVLRLKGLYHVRLWTLADWEQEAMMILHVLLRDHPHLKENIARLRIFFKTKFSNHVKDILRQQAALKRQFNRLATEDISELANRLSSRDMVVDDYVIYLDCLSKVKEHLSQEKLSMLEQVMVGESFKGKKAFVRELRGYFE